MASNETQRVSDQTLWVLSARDPDAPVGQPLDEEQDQRGEGGGIRIEQDGSVLTGTNVTISNNTAEVRGGGLHVANPGAVITLTDSVIQGNEATEEYGGGFYAAGTVNLTNTNVLENYTLDLSNANRRDGHGGGFYVGGNGGVLNMTDGEIKGNYAWGYGGGFTNHALAYLMLREIISENANVDPKDFRVAPYVSKALISFARYERDGVPALKLQPNTKRALLFF